MAEGGGTVDRRIARKDPELDAELDKVPEVQRPREHDSESALLRIQRLAGNRAALAAADQVGAATAPSLSDALAALRPSDAPDLRPALDPNAEARADAVASAVAPKKLRVSDGGPLPAEVRTSLEPKLG